MKLLKTKYPSIYYQNLKNGDISYYGKYRDRNGKSVRKKLGSKLKDKLNEKKSFLILEDIKSKEKNINCSIVPNDDIVFFNYLTLKDLGELYYEDRRKRKIEELKSYLSHIRNDEDLLSHNFVKKKLLMLDKELKKFNKNVVCFEISKIPVNQITRKHINRYIDLDLRDLYLNQKTKYTIINTIKTIFNFAIKKDIININNPFKNVKLHNPKNTRKRVLNENEILILLNKCKEYKKNINVYLSVYLAILTGGRAQTILGIRKKDIDINNKIIHLTNFKNKNHRYTIKLSLKSCEWLENKILPYYENNEFLIRSKSKKYRKNPPEPLNNIPEKVYKIMDELFNKNLDKSNNSDRDYVCNFHTLRRSIGSNLVKNGSSVYNVMKFLDHSSVNQTMEYLNIDSNDDIIDLMNNIFEKF